MVRQSIAEALTHLPDYFMQIHKSFIGNNRHIDSFRKEAINIKGREIPVGQVFREKIKLLLEQ
ncbi:MAG TPA: LytTR family transcriptional regulator DNA-binding domain-containing protein [Saprospiraceae bacterium]|nr:LytTR family transcriptional regulator DNA-binding domain-containing protein [Saprospiraceae bacterium]